MATLAQKEYSKNICCAIALVVLFPSIFIVNMQIRSGASIYTKLIFPLIVAVCFLIAFLIITFYDKFKPFKLKDYQWALIVFAGAILVSAIIFWIMLGTGNLDYWENKNNENYSPIIGYVGNSARMEGILAFFCYFMYFIAGSSITDRKYVKVILGVFVSVLIIASFFAVLEHFGYMYKDSKGNYLRPKVFCGNANFFASFTTLGIAVLSSYIVNTKKYFMLIGAIPVYVLVCFATVYNNSRSAWIGSFLAWVSIFAFIIWDFVRNRDIKDLLKKGLLLLLCGLIFLGVLVSVIKVFEPDTYSTRMEATIDQITGADEEIDSGETTGETEQELAQKLYNENYVKWGSGRGHSFKWGIKMLSSNLLFGTGPDNFRFAFPKEAYDETRSAYGKALAFDKAHNEYVHLGATLGIVGLFAYLVFVTLICINGFKGIKKEAQFYNDNEIIKKMLFAAVIGYLGQAYFNISVLQVAPFFWTFMGLLVADYFPKRINRKNNKKV